MRRLVGDDTILRREVEELLASHEEMPTLFDRVRRAVSDLGADEGETGSALVGTRIGGIASRGSEAPAVWVWCTRPSRRSPCGVWWR